MAVPVVPLNQITGFQRSGELEPRQITFKQSIDQSVKLDENLFAETLKEMQSIDAVEPTRAAGIGNLLSNSIMDAARLGHTVGQMKQDFALGRNDDLHGILITARKAGISNKLVGAVRNKLLEAFHELWRINV